MLNTHEAIRMRILANKGIFQCNALSLGEALRMKGDATLRFFEGCFNRLLMGFYRYEINSDDNTKYLDFVSDMKRCIKNYESTRNAEFLMDLANYAEREFNIGNHPDKHFESVDDGEHSQVRKN